MRTGIGYGVVLIVILTVFLSTTSCVENVDKTSFDDAPEINSMQSVHAFGIVKCLERRDIFIDFPAAIKEIHVQSGDKVKEGALLVSLDISNALLELGNLEKSLEMERTTLKKIQDEIFYLEKDIAAMKADNEKRENARISGSDLEIVNLKNLLSYAQADLSLANADMDSKSELFKQGKIAKKELEDVQKLVEEKKRRQTDAQIALDMLILVKEKEIEQAKREIQVKTQKIESTLSKDGIIEENKIMMIENELNNLKNRLDKPYISDGGIIAEADGIIDTIGYVTGEGINSSRKVISILDQQSLCIEANITEDFIQFVQLDAQVSFTIQADKRKKYSGRIVGIGSKAERSEQGTVIVIRIDILDRDDAIFPGYNADIEIPLQG